MATKFFCILLLGDTLTGENLSIITIMGHVNSELEVRTLGPPLYAKVCWSCVRFGDNDCGHIHPLRPLRTKNSLDWIGLMSSDTMMSRIRIREGVYWAWILLEFIRQLLYDWSFPFSPKLSAFLAKFHLRKPTLAFHVTFNHVGVLRGTWTDVWTYSCENGCKWFWNNSKFAFFVLFVAKMVSL